MTEIQTKLPRNELINLLVDRDGLVCSYPGCERPIDLDGTGPDETTVEHWYPKAWAFANGWTYDQVWDLSNLRLSHKRCNAKKGHLVPNEDGTLPDRKRKEFRYRRQKRAQRPEICTECNAGRNLDEGQVCNACGSGPQPARTPKWRQEKPKDCDHDVFFCSSCYLGFVERRSALDTLITGGEGYE